MEKFGDPVYGRRVQETEALFQELQTTAETVVPRRPALELRELDSRVSDGLKVELVWFPGEKDVCIILSDIATGDFAWGDVPGEMAMDAFLHPTNYTTLPGAST